MATFTITEPKPLIIPLEAAKRYARISGTDDDQILTTMALSAEALVAERAGIIISATEVTAVTQSGEGDEIKIPFKPIQSVKKVVLSSGAAVSKYTLEGDTLRIKDLPNGESVTATIVCGYSAEKDVPADIRLAILMQIAHLYDNRNAAEGHIAAGVESILRKFKKLHF